MQDVYARIVEGTREYFRKSGCKGAVIGVSGGVDSALSLKIAVDALGRENILGLIMPERGLTKQQNIDDARAWCEELGVEYRIIYINRFVKSYISSKWRTTKHAMMNLKSRIRATLLYLFANMNGALVVGTSNRTEIYLGYFTKYGDGAVDLEVIGSLYKSEVWELSRMLGVPEAIVTKAPSAELCEDHTDEEELGFTYKDADEVLRLMLDKGVKVDQIKNRHARKIAEIIAKTEHKRGSPPVIPRD